MSVAVNLAYVKTVGYKITVTALDEGGNRLSFSKSFDGLFTGALHFLADIWSGIVSEFHAAMKAVQAAVNKIIEGIKEKLGAVFKEVVESVKSRLRGLIERMKELIGKTVEWIEGNKRVSGATYEDVMQALNGFMELMMAMGMWLMALFLGAVAVIAVATIASGGLGALVEMVTNEILEEEVVPLLVSAASYDIMGKILDAVGARNPFSALMSWLGFTGGEVDKLYMLSNVAKAKMEKKVHVLGYYVGLALALSGLVAPLVIPMLRLDHNGTLIADGVCILIAVGGFAYSLWLSKKDSEVETKNAVSPPVSKLEEVLGILGIAAPVIKTMSDMRGS